MAFNVIFYTFGKKEQSTAVPSSGGKTVSCHANNTLDILAPEIVLDWRQESGLPTVYNYVRISDFGRYYWVTGWKNDGGIWSASLKVDVLASWKSQIGNNTCFIYRSSNSWDGQIVDTLYPTTTDIREQESSFSNPFVGGGLFNSAVGYDHVLGIIGKNGSCVKYRVFTWPQLIQLFNYLMSDGYYVDVLGVFGSNDASAKVALNPLQYITSIRAYPFDLHSSDVALETDYYVGLAQMDSSAGLGVFSCYRRLDPNTGLETSLYRRSTKINLEQALRGHPQQSRGVWVNAVHGSYTLSCPPFGVIKLDPVQVADSLSISLVMTCDLTTGQGSLLITYNKASSDTPPLTPNSQPVLITAPVGVDVPINQVTATGYGAHQAAEMLPGLLTIAAGIAAENPVMVAGGVASVAANAIGGATESRIPQTNKINSQGTLIGYQINSSIHAEYEMLSDDDLAGHGRPLCQARQISTIPGFITADAHELIVPGATESELTEIRTAVSAGFFYE